MTASNPHPDRSRGSRPSRFAWLLEKVIQHAWFSFGVLSLITVVTALGHYDPTILWPPTASEMVQEEDASSIQTDTPRRRQTPPVQPLQVGAADSIVVCQSDDIFSPAGATAVREVVAQLERLPYVKRVMWMDRKSVV